MVSIFHKDLARIQSGKAQVQEVGGHAVEDRGSKTNSNFQLLNEPSRISQHEVSES